MRLSSILKQYQLNSDVQFFDVIIESRINGQNSQAKEQFNLLPEASKKSFLKYIIYSQIPPIKDGLLEFFINAL